MDENPGRTSKFVSRIPVPQQLILTLLNMIIKKISSFIRAASGLLFGAEEGKGYFYQDIHIK